MKCSDILEVKNDFGIHSRPSARISKTAREFDCEITFEQDGEVCSAKSMLELIKGAYEKGSRILVQCEGQDAEQALEALRELFEEDFGER